jgi:tetratricopeptide (TPR) repeat protein
MDRQHRRDLKRDKFVDEVGSLTTRAKENQRLLYAITAVVVVLALIGYGIYFYGSNREQKAQAALGNAITAIDSPLIQAGNPNPGAKYKTEQERTGAAEAMFRDVQKNYSGTKAADVANIYLARIDASKGDVTTARKLLSDFISDHPRHLLVGAARYSLYQLRIANGEAPQVTIELNAELAKTTDQALPADALLALLAQSYDAQGNSEKSKETYRRIATQFPDSPYAMDAQRRSGPAGTVG